VAEEKLRGWKTLELASPVERTKKCGSVVPGKKQKQQPYAGSRDKPRPVGHIAVFFVRAGRAATQEADLSITKRLKEISKSETASERPENKKCGQTEERPWSKEGARANEAPRRHRTNFLEASRSRDTRDPAESRPGREKNHHTSYPEKGKNKEHPRPRDTDATDYSEKNWVQTSRRLVLRKKKNPTEEEREGARSTEG